MNPLPRTETLRAVARRVVWFKDPDAALAEPAHFLAHVMTYGTLEDVVAVQEAIGRDAFGEALDHAPPGVFDPRSWAYWHLVFVRSAPPLPVRSLAAPDQEKGSA